MRKTSFKIKYKLLFAAACLTGLLFSYCSILAANNQNCLERCTDCKLQSLQTKWPASPMGGVVLDNCSKLGTLVKYIYSWGISLGGIAVFIALVIAGFEYITSIGNPGKMKEAVDRIQSAAIGLALLLGSYAIFSLINPNITTLKTNFDFKAANESLNQCKTGDPKECCYKDGKLDPNCSPLDWHCCRSNDIQCMRTGKTTTLTGSGLADNACCCKNDECKSNYCNPNTNTCAPDLPVCMKTFNKPAMGCDVVKFFKGSGFQDATPVIVDSSQFNKDDFTAFTDVNFQALSYRAYRYKMGKDTNGQEIKLDDNGDPTQTCQIDISSCNNVTNLGSCKWICTDIPGKTAALIDCGPTACGCTVATCFQWEAGTAHCAQDNRDPQTQKVIAAASNPGYTGSDKIQAYIVQDQTKKGWLSQGTDQIQALYDMYKQGY